MAAVADWPIEDLIAATAAQDRTAFAALYKKTSAKLYGILLRILGDRAQADDAMQDVFVRIWRNAGGYDAGRGTPLSWLATIARNHAIDVRRREGARGAGRHAEVELDTIVDRNPGASGEMLAALKACLGRLEGDQRSLILSAYINGDSREELAARLDRPVGTIKSWLHRGLAALKSCLDG